VDADSSRSIWRSLTPAAKGLLPSDCLMGT